MDEYSVNTLSEDNFLASYYQYLSAFAEELLKDHLQFDFQ